MRNLFCTALVLAIAVCQTPATTVSSVDYVHPEPPKINDHTLHVLTPTLLELKLINTKAPDPAAVTNWNFVLAGVFTAPPAESFEVTADGKTNRVLGVHFKRRPLYAPVEVRDLRIENSLYLVLESPIADWELVQVRNPDEQLWPATMVFANTMDPLRYSPAIHVNQEGYMPGASKKAMIGYYAGDYGEMPIPATLGFELVEAASGLTVHTGSLVLRRDHGYKYTPLPYQQVYEADFSDFDEPGEYRLLVPTLGASLPFLIDDGIAMAFTRAYALGLYHQRCGTSTSLPFTRFTHDACHVRPAQVPIDDAGAFTWSWNTISNCAQQVNANNPTQAAPSLTSPSAQLFPFVNQGPVDVSQGHHDAGDYSKYTINSAHLIHYLTFAVDSLPGVGGFDNLGLPESGDKISDLLQQAKWEADFLAKMQDQDGGFYFLVYPQNRRYENSVTPDKGDPQVVWPKTSAATAASVAALAQIGSSASFRASYPEDANIYLQKAHLGWQFLLNAIAQHGKEGIYQKITHYGDNYTDKDELAWAACQMFLATGDPAIHQILLSWFDPADPATRRWGWWRMSECYGHAIRSYAFAVQSGRISSAGRLDAVFLAKCHAEIVKAGDDALKWSQDNAYGTSFPEPTKAVQGAGWYFSTDQAFDMAVAYQLNPKADYIEAMLANMNYEGGCNPVDVCYVTGLGWRRTRNIVSQWASTDSRGLPPSGLPMGNLQKEFHSLWYYDTDFNALCYPLNTASIPYPIYDRWGDVWNVQAEMVNVNAARSLGTLGFLAAQSSSFLAQPWQPPLVKINVPASATVGAPVKVTVELPSDLDAGGSRFTWEGRDQAPSFRETFRFVPVTPGLQWVEVEVQLPDGRRLFAHGNFTAN